MIRPCDAWGPFAEGLDEPERRARLRCLRAVVHLTTGPRGDALAELLRRAEHEPEILSQAVAALDRLAALDLRHVLASYAALSRPESRA